MIEIKNKGKKPVIYIRYKDGKVLYIGETDDHRKGRPFREENEKEKIGDWDSIKLLNASKNVSRRRYWEAYLICKLKPSSQYVSKYFSLDNLRRKNNKERLFYWLKQVETAELAGKEAKQFAKHFYTCYKLDQEEITSKNGQT